MCAFEAAGLGPEAYLGWLADTVSQAGWAVQAVYGDEAGPPWAYTIGIWRTHHGPELAMFGGPPEDMAVIMNSLGDRIAAGTAVAAGDEVDGLCPYPLAIRPVHHSWRTTSMFAMSDQFYAGLRPPILQVVWPDRDGRFPWAPQFSAEFADQQPFLWLPRDDHPPGPWSQIDG